MRYERSFQQTRSLLRHALIATGAVVLLPALAAVAAAGLLPEPRLLLALLVGILVAGAVASVGANLWLRRPESMSVAFGELMLWRYLRRRRADERIATGVEVLGFDPSGAAPREVDLDPDRHLDVLHDLSAALETKDPYTGGHSRRVERHVYRTGMALSLHSGEIEELRLAASLHDVGKINVPDRILRKPDGLTPEERAIVEEHAPLGASMVAGTVPESVVEAILHHHESWDGTGYPDGLAAHDIPLLARIICVADAYDAMTSARPYRPGSSRHEAIDALRLNAGVQFDPDVVEAFISTLPAALPVAGAFAIFALPAENVRRLTVWLKNTGAGSIATAAGSAGMVALLGTASLVGTPALPSPSIAAPAPPPVHAPPPLDADVEPASEEVLDDLFGRVEERAEVPVVTERNAPIVAAAPAPAEPVANNAPKEKEAPPPSVIEQPSGPGAPPQDPPPPNDPPENEAEDPPDDEAEDPPEDEAEVAECSKTNNGSGENKGKEKGKGHAKAKGEGHSKHC